MKKLFFIILLLTGTLVITVFASAASNNVTVVLPAYKCNINETGVSLNDSQYPLLSYNDITYFPMTWNYCKSMDLVTEWVDGQGLYIASKPTYDKPEFQVYPLDKNAKNTSKMTATKVTYPVYIDGEPAPVDERYPLLNFRNITYFPMTWTYAHDMFGWNLDFQDRVFKVDTFLDRPDRLNYSRIWSENGIYYGEQSEKSSLTEYLYNVYYWDSATGKTTLEKENITHEEYDAFFSSKSKDNSVITNDVSDEILLKDNHIYFRNNLMSDSNGPINFDKEEDGIFAEEKTAHGVTWLEMLIYNREIAESSVNGKWTGTKFCYFKYDAEYKFIASGSGLDECNIGKTNTDTYIELKKVWYSVHRRDSVISYVYKMDAAGNVSCLNGSAPLFSDYHSICLVGVTKNNAYLKCLWAPDETENGGPYLGSIEVENALTVSPAKDGFFSYDGKTLKQLRKYIYSYDMGVSENGDVWIIDAKGNFKKI